MTFTSRKSHSKEMSKVERDLNDYIDSESIKSKTSSFKKDISIVDSREHLGAGNITNKVPVSFYNLMRKKHSSNVEGRMNINPIIMNENITGAAGGYQSNNILLEPQGDRSYFKDESRILNEADVNFNIHLDMEENKK
jgi:hypothetical protein